MIVPSSAGRGRSSAVCALARLACVLAAALAASVSASACKRPGAPPRQPAAAAPPASQAPANAVRIVLAYGSEKKTWLEEQLAAFAASAPQVDGRPIVVEPRAMGSGEALQAILRGELTPHVLSPASGAYLTLLNDGWRAKSGRAAALAPPGEPLLLSPIVIALWKPMAEALGWPGKRIGWSDLLRVARQPAGWGALGHPEWGAFKLGHTHPELSNSGLLAVLAAAYAGAGKTRGLTAADLRRPPVRTFLGAVERSIVHYGTSTGFFADRMRARGPEYLSAAVVYENLVIESYGAAPPAPMPIVSIYPREGTFWCDHPYSILDAPWVTRPERKAAEALLAFLRARPAQERALALGFRPGDPAVALAAPIDGAHGADPKQPQTLLEIPEAATLTALLQAWRAAKRPAEVVLVFDKSGSMAGAPLKEAKRGARAFLDRLGATDEVTLLFFDFLVRAPLGPISLAEGKRELLDRIDGVQAGGGTALYEAVSEAHRLARARAAAAPDRIQAVVVMTDGRNEIAGGVTLPELVDQVRAEAGGDRVVRVFAIAYGAGADQTVLQQIAEAAQGTSAKGDLRDIVKVYDEMAAFF